MLSSVYTPPNDEKVTKKILRTPWAPKVEQISDSTKATTRTDQDFDPENYPTRWDLSKIRQNLSKDQEGQLAVRNRSSLVNSPEMEKVATVSTPPNDEKLMEKIKRTPWAPKVEQISDSTKATIRTDQDFEPENYPTRWDLRSLMHPSPIRLNLSEDQVVELAVSSNRSTLQPKNDVNSPEMEKVAAVSTPPNDEKLMEKIKRTPWAPKVDERSVSRNDPAVISGPETEKMQSATQFGFASLFTAIREWLVNIWQSKSGRVNLV